jgi:hypothetical protein
MKLSGDRQTRPAWFRGRKSDFYASADCRPPDASVKIWVFFQKPVTRQRPKGVLSKVRNHAQVCEKSNEKGFTGEFSGDIIASPGIS